MNLILHDRTNSDSPTLQPSKVIRRVQSSRLSRFHIDSDDTLPSEHSSIYDALLVSPDGDGPHEDKTSPPDLQKRLIGLPLSPSFENLDQLAGLPSGHQTQVQEVVPTSHSNWPPTQLETIIEQRSMSTIHKSVSLPRLNSAELEKSNLQRLSERSSAATKKLNHRSFSENDASCLHLPSWKAKGSMYKEYQSDSSSSSEDLLRRRCLQLWPKYPLKPNYPPLERSPTPPGLPTFGTREAVELLDVPSVRDTPARSTQGRQSTHAGLPATVAEEVPLPPIAPVLRPVNLPNPPKGKSVTRSIIRSFCRSSSAEFHEGEVRRVSLPASFITQADDGTLVRGRFGARSSGHGLVARAGQQSIGLERHPFHRLEPAARLLEEEVREIDKACGAPEQARPQRVEGNVVAGASIGIQNLSSQCPAARLEYGRPSRAYAPTWRPFWSDRVNDTAVPLQAGGVPAAPRVRPATQPPPVGVEETYQDRMLRRRLSAQSVVWAARLQELTEEREQIGEPCEGRCWDWMRGCCIVGYSAAKVEARALCEEDRRIAFRRSSHVQGEPILPNARIVYPTLVSE